MNFRSSTNLRSTKSVRSLRVPWYQKPILHDAFFLDLQRGSLLTAFISLVRIKCFIDIFHLKFSITLDYDNFWLAFSLICKLFIMMLDSYFILIILIHLFFTLYKLKLLLTLIWINFYFLIYFFSSFLCSHLPK